MRLRSLVVALLGVCLISIPTPTRSQDGPPASLDALLDGSALHDIWLRINAQDWEQLHSNYSENTYYPADFEWQGIRVRNSGIRTRGRTTRNDHKPSLRVDFNRYVTGQRFLGVKALVLNSMWMDPSMLRDRLSMLVFQRVGIPAPRASHARLFVGAERAFVGVYSVVEEVDTSFLEANFGEKDGYLYEYHPLDVYGLQDPGPSLDWYGLRFDPRTHESASMADLYLPLRSMVEAVNDVPASNLEDGLRDYLNIETFITELAVQDFVAQQDGLLGQFGMNNFYLYRFAGTRLFQFIPWDQDGAFRLLTRLPWENIHTNVLAAKIWSEPRYREAYLRKLLEIADLVGAPAGTPTVDDPSIRACPARPDTTPCAWLEQEVFRAYGQIRAAVHEDPLAPYPSDEFERDVALVQQFARDRAGVVRQYVAEVAPELVVGNGSRTLTSRSWNPGTVGAARDRPGAALSGNYPIPNLPGRKPE